MILNDGELVSQFVGQNLVASTDDLNGGSMARVGSVLMPVGTSLRALSSVGSGAGALVVIAIPQRGSVVLLTRPTTAVPDGSATSSEVVDGVQVSLADDEQIVTVDCTLDGQFPDGRLVAIVSGEPEHDKKFPAQQAWLVNDDISSLEPIDPIRVFCSLPNPD